MSLPTLLWLLPIVFMFHDFEEIIMMKSWIGKNSSLLHARFPRLADRLLGHAENLSTSAFALAVAEEFELLSVLTGLAVERRLYSFWVGMLLGFFLHLLVHLAQTLIYRRYTPVIVTSPLAGVYCVYALRRLASGGYLDWGQVAAWTGLAVVVLLINLIFALRLAARFDRWLRSYSLPA